ncbi:hypothetical protein FHT71_001711 [Rhizobium sp. BK060]|nr:hypothetical protein [Rhizobium sp. BK060]
MRDLVIVSDKYSSWTPIASLLECSRTFATNPEHMPNTATTASLLVAAAAGHMNDNMGWVLCFHKNGFVVPLQFSEVLLYRSKGI